MRRPQYNAWAIFLMSRIEAVEFFPAMIFLMASSLMPVAPAISSTLRPLSSIIILADIPKISCWLSCRIGPPWWFGRLWRFAVEIAYKRNN